MLALVVLGVQFARAAKTSYSDGNPSLGIKGTNVYAPYLNAVNNHFHTGLDSDGEGSLCIRLLQAQMTW